MGVGRAMCELGHIVPLPIVARGLVRKGAPPCPARPLPAHSENRWGRERGRSIPILGPRVMSPLSLQSGPKRTSIGSLSQSRFYELHAPRIAMELRFVML
jgi:hypothetical protein